MTEENPKDALTQMLSSWANRLYQIGFLGEDVMGENAFTFLQHYEDFLTDEQKQICAKELKMLRVILESEHWNGLEFENDEKSEMRYPDINRLKSGFQDVMFVAETPSLKEEVEQLKKSRYVSSAEIVGDMSVKIDCEAIDLRTNTELLFTVQITLSDDYPVSPAKEIRIVDCSEYPKVLCINQKTGILSSHTLCFKTKLRLMYLVSEICDIVGEDDRIHFAREAEKKSSTEVVKSTDTCPDDVKPTEENKECETPTVVAGSQYDDPDLLKLFQSDVSEYEKQKFESFKRIAKDLKRSDEKVEVPVESIVTENNREKYLFEVFQKLLVIEGGSMEEADVLNYILGEIEKVPDFKMLKIVKDYENMGVMVIVPCEKNIAPSHSVLFDAHVDTVETTHLPPVFFSEKIRKLEGQERIICRATGLDNRIHCALLLTMIKYLRFENISYVALFSINEESGMTGLDHFCSNIDLEMDYGILPDKIVVLDVTQARLQNRSSYYENAPIIGGGIIGPDCTQDFAKYNYMGVCHARAFTGMYKEINTVRYAVGCCDMHARVSHASLSDLFDLFTFFQSEFVEVMEKEEKKRVTKMYMVKLEEREMKEEIRSLRERKKKMEKLYKDTWVEYKSNLEKVDELKSQIEDLKKKMESAEKEEELEKNDSDDDEICDSVALKRDPKKMKITLKQLEKGLSECVQSAELFKLKKTELKRNLEFIRLQKKHKKTQLALSKMKRKKKAFRKKILEKRSKLLSSNEK